MIEVKNLTLTLREPILSNTSFTFEDGRIYLLHALNGTGKTSVLRTMVKMLAPSSGQILFDGHDFDKIKNQVFYLETSDWLDKNLSGHDYMQFVRSEWHSKREIQEEIDFWEMGSYIKEPIKKYSLGMKQKLIVALYILSDAKYLLMDEINNGLDVDSRQILYRELTVLAKRGKLIIITSHYRDEVEQVVNETLTLKNYQLVQG